MKARTAFFIILSVVVVFDTHFISAARPAAASGKIVTLQVPAAAGSSSTVAVDLYVPSGKIYGDLLVLPGWNFSRVRWHNETRLLAFADKYGYRCVFPDMKTSCYESSYFPETRIKWSLMPGGAWVRDVLLPFMQSNHKIFTAGAYNCILGLSTGGRGAALVSLQNPGLFKALAALSGDFNQLDMPQDKLMAGIYGDIAAFSARWQTIDNPYAAAAAGEWKIPIYIGHGENDRVVPISQSRNFYKLLVEKYPKIKTAFHAAPGAGHDFAYWDSELEGVFEFFKAAKK